jgi:hypothetical protein
MSNRAIEIGTNWKERHNDRSLRVQERQISRHKSMDTLQGYVRDAEFFRDHAGNGLL